MSSKSKISSVGIVGFGAFGQLIAAHLHHHFPLVINDQAGGTLSPLAQALTLGGLRLHVASHP